MKNKLILLSTSLLATTAVASFVVPMANTQQVSKQTNALAPGDAVITHTASLSGNKSSYGTLSYSVSENVLTINGEVNINGSKKSLTGGTFFLNDGTSCILSCDDEGNDGGVLFYGSDGVLPTL